MLLKGEKGLVWEGWDLSSKHFCPGSTFKETAKGGLRFANPPYNPDGGESGIVKGYSTCPRSARRWEEGTGVEGMETYLERFA